MNITRRQSITFDPIEPNSQSEDAEPEWGPDWDDHEEWDLASEAEHDVNT